MSLLIQMIFRICLKKLYDLLEQEEGTRVILLLGFGLGGYPEVLHENFKGDGVLIVYEAVPELFKIALQEQGPHIPFVF